MKNLFYKPVKINAKNHEILFWGCLHYGHDPKWEVPIWKSRGFNSSKEHDTGIISNWNSKANKNTIGFLLGDTMFGYGGAEKFTSLMKSLNFKKVYVMSGNHIAGWHQAFESVEDNVLQIDDKEVVFVPNYLEAYVNGQAIVASHYPLASWNGQGKNSIMIHSHTHSNLYNTPLGDILYKAKIMDVGVENCPFPISFGEIKSKFDKNSVSFDHHTSQTKNPF
jgi:calcineurin-like phosphoesterase family protein